MWAPVSWRSVTPTAAANVSCWCRMIAGLWSVLLSCALLSLAVTKLGEDREVMRGGVRECAEGRDTTGERIARYCGLIFASVGYKGTHNEITVTGSCAAHQPTATARYFRFLPHLFPAEQDFNYRPRSFFQTPRGDLSLPTQKALPLLATAKYFHFLVYFQPRRIFNCSTES